MKIIIGISLNSLSYSTSIKSPDGVTGKFYNFANKCYDTKRIRIFIRKLSTYKFVAILNFLNLVAPWLQSIQKINQSMPSACVLSFI